MSKNRLRNFRESQLLTKAELARRAGISTLTIDRIEAGQDCRMDTKRKIILALGLEVADKNVIFGGPQRAPQPRVTREPAMNHTVSAQSVSRRTVAEQATLAQPVTVQAKRGKNGSR